MPASECPFQIQPHCEVLRTQAKLIARALASKSLPLPLWDRLSDFHPSPDVSYKRPRKAECRKQDRNTYLIRTHGEGLGPPLRECQSRPFPEFLGIAGSELCTVDRGDNCRYLPTYVTSRGLEARSVPLFRWFPPALPAVNKPGFYF